MPAVPKPSKAAAAGAADREAFVERLDALLERPDSRLRLLLDATEAAMAFAAAMGSAPTPAVARPYAEQLAGLRKRLGAFGPMDLLAELQRELFPGEFGAG